MKKDYSDKNVDFYFVYKSLAHPEGGSQAYVAPVTLEERLQHIKQAYRELGNTIPWISDNMKNELKHALGNRPNSEFIINPAGKIVAMRDWSNPASLRSELEKLVGKVDRPTPVSEINLKTSRPKSTVKSGVVKRPTLPTSMRPLVAETSESKLPYYAKLRVEAEPSVLSNGNGKIYLGFHLDPIYSVHWNHLNDPLEYEIKSIKRGMITPSKDAYPKVDIEIDKDPREFVIDVSGLRASTELEIVVRYFVCGDIEEWCRSVEQTYTVTIQVDSDGGSARRSGARGGMGRVRPGRGAGANMERGNTQRGQQRRFTAERFMAMDRNQDGKVSVDEMPAAMRRMLDRADQNGDQAIDRKEAEEMEKRMNRRR